MGDQTKAALHLGLLDRVVNPQSVLVAAVPIGIQVGNAALARKMALGESPIKDRLSPGPPITPDIAVIQKSGHIESPLTKKNPQGTVGIEAGPKNRKASEIIRNLILYRAKKASTDITQVREDIRMTPIECTSIAPLLGGIVTIRPQREAYLHSMKI
jgi:hypothetical protein